LCPCTLGVGRLHRLCPHHTARWAAPQETKVALDWLAAFHAFWWEQPPPPGACSSPRHPPPGAPGVAWQALPAHGACPWRCAGRGAQADARAGASDAGLWQDGCYWHLATRQDELRAIGGSWGQLKASADAIDAAICSAPPDCSSSGGGGDEEAAPRGRFRTWVGC